MTLALAALVSCGRGEDAWGLQDNPADRILLKDYRPKSVFNVPVTLVEKAKYPVIDMHTHDYVGTKEEVASVVDLMDKAGIEVGHIMHCNWIGEPFDVVVEKYSGYKDRFRFWCCIDYTGFGQDDWADRAIAELERCREVGAVGIGELGDKGLGDMYARPVEGKGIRLNDPKLRPVLAWAAEHGWPVSVHIAEPIWMYEAVDERNDGLMNGAKWQVDTTVEGCMGYDRLMEMFEDAVASNPNTIFIADHLLNMSHDLPRLGRLMDKYRNLYVDISGRFSESSVTPRATRAFMVKYQDRILYGTDNTPSERMYAHTFRIMETADEHIYSDDSYHWALSGWDLPDSVLKKIYRDNALGLMSGK